MPIAAKGPQAANILGTLDQTELYQVLKGLAPAGTDVEAPVTTATVAPAADARRLAHDRPGDDHAERHRRDLGVASTEYRLNGGAWTPYSRADPGRGGGHHDGRVPLHRQRRQRRDDPVTDVKIDSTAPTATVALNPAAPGAGGTYSTRSA